MRDEQIWRKAEECNVLCSISRQKSRTPCNAVKSKLSGDKEHEERKGHISFKLSYRKKAFFPQTEISRGQSDAEPKSAPSNKQWQMKRAYHFGVDVCTSLSFSEAKWVQGASLHNELQAAQLANIMSAFIFTGRYCVYVCVWMFFSFHMLLSISMHTAVPHQLNFSLHSHSDSCVSQGDEVRWGVFTKCVCLLMKTYEARPLSESRRASLSAQCCCGQMGIHACLPCCCSPEQSRKTTQ